MVTKDGNLCGILLTSFHDETILIKQEYTHIFQVQSLLKIIPSTLESYVSGKIYALLLNATYKLCDDYFGSIYHVFEKLDSFIRIKRSNYEIDMTEVKETIVLGIDENLTRIQRPSTQRHSLEHWMKMVDIYRHMVQFLVENNIPTTLANIKTETKLTLEDTCSEIAECIMCMIGITQCYLSSHFDLTKPMTDGIMQLMTDSYSVLLSIFSFAPSCAIRTFGSFKSCVIQTQHEDQTYACPLYGKLFGFILNIHFKMLKEVNFLGTLFRVTDDSAKRNANNRYCLPETAYRAALHQIFSGVSSERILSGWFSYIVLNFNVKDFLSSLKFSTYQVYCFCTTLSITLEVILVKDASNNVETAASHKRLELLATIKEKLGQMNTLLSKNKSNAIVYSSVLQVCVNWGAFQIMCDEYRGTDMDTHYTLPLNKEDPAVIVLHNYFTNTEWNRICKTVTTHYKDNVLVMDAWSELFAQVLNLLHSHLNINSDYYPDQSTAAYLVKHSHCSWLLRRAHLLDTYLTSKNQWKLAKKLSVYLVKTEDCRSLLEGNSTLNELNVQVFGIAFHTLREAIKQTGSKALDVLNKHEDEILQLAFIEEHNSPAPKCLIHAKLESDSDENEETSNSEISEGENKVKFTRNSDKADEILRRQSVRNKKKRRLIFTEEVDSDDSELESAMFSKRRKPVTDMKLNERLIKLLVDKRNHDQELSGDIADAVNKCLSVVEVLPVQHLETASQQLLFLLVLLCGGTSTKARPIVSRFLLSKNFSIPSTKVLPYLLNWILGSGSKIHVQEMLAKICKLAMDEHAIRALYKFCELSKKTTSDIDVDIMRAQSQITYHFLTELGKLKTSNKTIMELKKKIISRTHRNFKNLKLNPTEDTLQLFGFMLQESLKEHDSESIEVLCANINSYLDLALEVENIALIELVLTYSDLTLKKYVPPEFTPRVWSKLPSCANLCFQSATFAQFNEFLTEMFEQTEALLTDSCDLTRLESNFELWRKLLASNLSRNSNIARLAKLEALISCLSTHVTLHTSHSTPHFPIILQLVLDIVNSPVFTCVNTSVVHFLFNLLTPQSCTYFKLCIRILQYLITKKASIVSDETALFLLKYQSLLSQVTKHVCSTACAQGESDVLFIAMEKLAHAIRKNKKSFQRVAPYTLSNIMQLYQVHKFPLDVTVHMNEISYIFISICDPPGIDFLKHSLPDSCKQVFLQTLNNYTKYSSQRFV